MNDDDGLMPCEMACLDLDGNRVYVLFGGTTTCPEGQREEFISIGVRDSDSDDEVVSRTEYRELINIDPFSAIRLSRCLLDYALGMLDDRHDDDEEEDES
jgi:hypothetical protein